MGRLSQRIAVLRQRFNDLKPATRIAILVAAVLVLWTGFQGTRYAMASRELVPLETQISALEDKIGAPIPAVGELEEELDSRKQQLEGWKPVFTYGGFPQTDPLVEIITNTAIESGVNLEAIGLDPARAFVKDKVQYQAQPVNLSLTSSAHSDVSVFLFLLSKKLPFFEVESIDFAGFGEEPFASMELLFYVDPVPVQ